jgi:hypothetical protein
MKLLSPQATQRIIVFYWKGLQMTRLISCSQIAVMLDTLPGLNGMVGNRGSAQFSVSTGNVAVLGLVFLGAAFTSIPTFDN